MDHVDVITAESLLKVLADAIDSSNVVRHLLAAYLHKAVDLFDSALDFVADNKDEICNSPAMEHLMEEFPELVAPIQRQIWTQLNYLKNNKMNNFNSTSVKSRYPRFMVKLAVKYLAAGRFQFSQIPLQREASLTKKFPTWICLITRKNVARHLANFSSSVPNFLFPKKFPGTAAGTKSSVSPAGEWQISHRILFFPNSFFLPNSWNCIKYF